jgi:hypothetical protein
VRISGEETVLDVAEPRKHIHVITCTDVPGPSTDYVAQKSYSAVEEAQRRTLMVDAIERKREQVEQA